MRIARGVPNATNTHSEYVILTAFPLQQWLQERISMLRYKRIACIVNFASTDVCLYAVAQSDFWSSSSS